MSVQLNITFEELVELIDQLKPEEQRALVERLRKRELSTEKWTEMFQLLIIDSPILEPFSLRREDWYGDDGR